MATKIKTKNKEIRKIQIAEPKPVVVEISTPIYKTWNFWRFAIAAVLLLGLFWYKTNSWPIVALVDNRPIFRWQLDKVLYAQAGRQALDSLVVEQLIANEVKNKKIVIQDSEVQTKIDQIKGQMGSEESFIQALAAQGLTEAELKNQFKLQLALEKLVEPSTDSAVLQERVYGYVESLRSSNRVKEFLQ